MSRDLDDNLNFGDATVDDQHRKILEQYEILSEALREGNSTVIIDKMAQFLLHYTGEHFDAEDRLMLRYRYPHLEEHRQEHAAFERDVNRLKQRISQEGPTRELAAAATGVLYRYIVNHINKSDAQLAAYLQERSTH